MSQLLLDTHTDRQKKIEDKKEGNETEGVLHWIGLVKG